MISELEVLYRGTAAGMREKPPLPLHCMACGQIIETVDRGRCADCRGEGIPNSPSCTACREGFHERCDGSYARVYGCGCQCHEREAS